MIIALAFLSLTPTVLIVGNLKLTHILKQLTDVTEDGS